MTEKWTTANMPDLTGKVMVVTGANSGIGYEAAKEFARKGAQTILACRNLDKAQRALAKIQAEIPNAPAEIMLLDLASQESIRQFAAAFKEKYDRLDVLVNNAGIMMRPYEITEDGFESQLGTNHLGHFALTGLLIDLLLNTSGARVVNISSMGHNFGKMEFDNLMFDNGKDYSPVEAYGRSKLANLLFTYELQRFFVQHGVNALAVSAHPGSSNTNLTQHLESTWYLRLAIPFMLRFAQSAAMGALPTLRAAVDPQVKAGECYAPNGIWQQRGHPVIVKSSPASYNAADARQLWQISEELTGIKYPQAIEA